MSEQLSEAETDATSTSDALAVVLESNLPTFVAGSTKIVGALRHAQVLAGAAGCHPAAKRLFARCAACGKFAALQRLGRGAARRSGGPAGDVLAVRLPPVDIEKNTGAPRTPGRQADIPGSTASP